MKTRLFFILATLAMLQVQGQFSIVTLDSLTNEPGFIDNALLFTPDGFDEPQPSYVVVDHTDNNEVTFPSIALSEEALNSVTGAFQSWPSFDYVFPRNIDRNPGDTIIVEFDLMFSALGGSGESGRMNITLLSELPPGGITEDNFGRPAYHFWLFNGNYSAALSYGGEFDDNPGWNSGAGGYYYNENAGDPNTAVLFPESDNYPLVPYSKNQSGAIVVSATSWKTYTWVVARDMMHLYWRDAGSDPSENEEIVYMAIPQNGSIDFINEVHGTFATQLPPEYEWFENINGIRFWARGASNQTPYITNLKITKSGVPVTTYAVFQQRPVSQRRPRADAGTYNLPVMLYNGIDGGNAQVTIELAKGNSAHIDGFTEGIVEFANTTSTDFQLESLELTLTDMYMNDNDTLLFEITQITGGEEHAAPGPNRFFELIIRPSGAEPPTNINEWETKNWSVSPNPVNHSFRLTEINRAANVNLAIYDITGKRVYFSEHYDGGDIDVSAFNQGVYLLRLFNDDVVVTRKFVKQ